MANLLNIHSSNHVPDHSERLLISEFGRNCVIDGQIVRQTGGVSNAGS